MRLIDTPELYADACKRLRSSSVIGVDIESNGFFAYFEQVCLIQIGNGREEFIFDPLMLDDLSFLGNLFANPRVMKIFHGGGYDVVSLKRDFGFQFSNLFDTAIASRLMDEQNQEMSLANLLAKHFDFHMDKSLQRSDWGQRPLSRAHLEYAALDVKFLDELSEILQEQLEEAGLWEHAQAEFAKLCTRNWAGTSFNPEGYKKVKGYWDLRKSGRRLLRDLYHVRDRWARKLDRPAFKVVGNLGLLNLARYRPVTEQAVRRCKGFPQNAPQGLVEQCLDYLQRAPAVAAEVPFSSAKRKARRKRRRRKPA